MKFKNQSGEVVKWKKKRQKSNFIEIFEEKVNSVNVIYKKHVISIQHQERLKFFTTQIGKKI